MTLQSHSRKIIPAFLFLLVCSKIGCAVKWLRKLIQNPLKTLSIDPSHLYVNQLFTEILPTIPDHIPQNKNIRFYFVLSSCLSFFSK